MKVKMLLFVTLCWLLTGGAAASLTSFPTGIEHPVTSKGSYVNWAGVSSVSQFADENGKFCFAVDEGEKVSVYKTDGGQVTKKIEIANPYDSFGAAACDGDGYLYMVWGRNNQTDDTSVSTIIVGKYTPEGAFVASAGGNGSEGMADYYDEEFYTKTPFDGGNCDVAINGDTLLVNYARKMYGGHQANTVFVADTKTMTVKKGVISYNSHSFDQRVTPYGKTGGFLLESQGDCFPRGFATALTDGEKTLNEMLTFNFWVQPNAYTEYDMYKLNATRAKLGNILETSQGAALVGASARSLSEAAMAEPYDLFVQAFDPAGKADGPDSYFTSGVRSGLAGNNGDEEVTDYGVRWLTDLAGTEQSVNAAQAVSAEDDKIAVLYELYSSSRYDSTWCVLLNGDGSVFRKAFSLGSVRLNPDEDPVYAQGAVQWVSNDSGSDALTLRRLSLSPDESDPSGGGETPKLEWTRQGDSVTVSGAFEATDNVIAACYDSNGRMIGLKAVTQSGGAAPILENANVMKLFWLDSAFAPKCAVTEIPVSGAAA